MKKIHLILAMIGLVVVSYSQAPNAFNYQAILRNSDGTVKAYESVVIQISIINDTGVSVYTETHDAQTNEFGLVNLFVGKGTSEQNLSMVDWSSGPYYLEVILNGENLGMSPINSVPYALYTASGGEGVEGPQGEPGPEGPAGPQGPQGVPGESLWTDNSGDISYVNGNVGIGTSSPQTLLHVHGSPLLANQRGHLSLSAPAGKDVWLSFFEDNSYKGYLWWNASAGDLRLQSLGSGDLGLNTSGGKVGIGTTEPTEKLDIDGNLRVRGDIIVDGSGEGGSGISISELLALLQRKNIIPNNYAGNVTDIDGNVYLTVKIGDQIWMADNLRATRYNDGTAIPLVTDNFAWGNLSTPAYCWYNNDSITYSDPYGALYNWYAVNTLSTGGRNVCPSGWHVPSDAEWTDLTSYLGGTSVAGGKLKATIYWESPNAGATNETAFTALPGGLRSYVLSFVDIGYYGLWWSSSESEYESWSAWWRNMRNSLSSVGRGGGYKQNGLSVRCLRD